MCNYLLIKPNETSLHREIDYNENWSIMWTPVGVDATTCIKHQVYIITNGLTNFFKLAILQLSCRYLSHVSLFLGKNWCEYSHTKPYGASAHGHTHS